MTVAKRIRKLYGFRRVLDVMLSDEDQEIVYILRTHPLTRKKYREFKSQSVGLASEVSSEGEVCIDSSVPFLVCKKQVIRISLQKRTGTPPSA